MNKLILIHNNVPDKNIFESYLFNDVNKYSNFNELPSTFNKNSIERLGFVWHNDGLVKIPFFNNIDTNNLEENEIEEEFILKNYENLTDIDLITCNINSDIWFNYLENIKQSLQKYNINVNIHFSLNQTGNGINSDWILESDNIDLINEQIYFDNKMLDYKFILDGQTSASSGEYFKDANNVYLPFKYVSNTTNGGRKIIYDTEGGYTINNNCYIKLANGDEVYGNDDESTIVIIPVPSSRNHLFNITYYGNSNFTTSPIIKNMNFQHNNNPTITFTPISNFSESFTLENILNDCNITSGGICGNYLNYNSNGSSINISNCQFTGTISASNCGGIVGNNSLYQSDGGSISITDCTVSTNINNNNCGGIVGRYSQIKSPNSYYLIQNCHFTGELNGSYNGCIIGSNSQHQSDNSIFNIINCISSGTINGDYNGGIVGQQSQYNSNNSIYTIEENCHSDCFMEGDYCGGIAGDSGQYQCTNSTYNIIDSYSTKDINGQRSAGIIGNDFQRHSETSVLNITDCYSIGNMVGNYTSGICAQNLQNRTNNCTTNINRCFSTGSIGGQNGGGIIGTGCGFRSGNGSTFNITNCFSTGDMIGLFSTGGIIATNLLYQAGSSTVYNTGLPQTSGSIVNIVNCYSTGDITDNIAGGGGIISSSCFLNSVNCQVNIDLCFTSGKISKASGGIIGKSLFNKSGNNNTINNTITINECVTIGDIYSDNNQNGGGIFGNSVGGSNNTNENNKIIVKNCVVLGKIIYDSSNLTSGKGKCLGSLGWSNKLQLEFTNNIFFCIYNDNSIYGEDNRGEIFDQYNTDNHSLIANNNVSVMKPYNSYDQNSDSGNTKQFYYFNDLFYNNDYRNNFISYLLNSNSDFIDFSSSTIDSITFDINSNRTQTSISLILYQISRLITFELGENDYIINDVNRGFDFSTLPTITTVTPTTLAPTTLAPTTLAPTTLAPTTLAPTTLAPTTLAPTTTVQIFSLQVDINYALDNILTNLDLDSTVTQTETKIFFNLININFASILINTKIKKKDTIKYINDKIIELYSDIINDKKLIVILPQNNFKLSTDRPNKRKIKTLYQGPKTTYDISDINTDESFYCPLYNAGDIFEITTPSGNIIKLENIDGTDYDLKHLDSNNNIITDYGHKKDGDFVTIDRVFLQIGSVQGYWINNASSSGDPYINTLDGYTYKLPNKFSNYRLFQSNDLIINATVDKMPKNYENMMKQIYESEIFKNKNKELSDENLIRVDNGYFYNNFFIKFKNSIIIFDINIDIKENNIINKEIEIIKDEKYRFINSPIEGKSYYKSTFIKLVTEENGNIEIELRKFFNFKIINGININIEHITNNIKGLLIHNIHPKNNKIKKLTSINKIKYKTTKPYKFELKEVWINNK